MVEPIIEKTFNEDINIEKYLREGGILARLYLEVQGNDQNAVEIALEKTVFEQLNGEGGVKLLKVRLYKVEKAGENYSGVVEIKLLLSEFRWFVSVVMRYGPTAIEVIEPDEVILSTDQMHSLLADVSEVGQSLSAQILSLLTDDERRAVYEKMIKTPGE